MSEDQVFHISDLGQLRVLVFLIGYVDQGESIIVLLKDGEGPSLYCIVVDSYEIDGLNKTAEILRRLGVEHINLLCWSHPDKDHSVGLETLIAGFCNKESIILLPFGLVERVPIRDLGDVAPVISRVFQLGTQRTKPVYSVSSHLRSYDPVASFSITDDFSHEAEIRIRALAPNNEFILDKIHGNEEVDKNTLSIFLSVDIGPYRFLLTGDAEDMMIGKIAPQDYQDPVWVKIPHHASYSSISLLNFLLTGNYPQVLSGTTIKKTSSLPNENVLKSYMAICEQVNATGSLKQKPLDKFGIVSYSFDLFGKRVVKIHCEGNAIVCV